MPLTRLEVNPRELQDVVRELESKQTFSSVTALWNEVCKTLWASKQKRRLSRPTIAAIAARHGITYRTRTITKRGGSRKNAAQKEEGWAYRIVYQNLKEPTILARIIKVRHPVKTLEDIERLQNEQRILIISITELT